MSSRKNNQIIQVKIIDITPMYKRFSSEADAVTSIIDFVTFKIMWLNVIVNNNAIASLFPIFVLSINLILSFSRFGILTKKRKS